MAVAIKPTVRRGYVTRTSIPSTLNKSATSAFETWPTETAAITRDLNVPNTLSRSGKPYSLLKQATVNVIDSFRKTTPSYDFKPSSMFKRCLTKPNLACHNNGHDNVDDDLILYCRDMLGDTYRAVDHLGKGTYGQVIKCLNVLTMEYVAVKIAKSRFTDTAKAEAKVMRNLQATTDGNGSANIVLMTNEFMFKGHYCIVLEFMDCDLYTYMTTWTLPMNGIAFIAHQVLRGLMPLHASNRVHGDLKPENVLVRQPRCEKKLAPIRVVVASLDDVHIKLADFGSVFLEGHNSQTYIQTRHYRAPEVILGQRLGKPIDVWSLGCIIYELFTGLPIFYAHNEHQILVQMTMLLGPPPTDHIFEGRYRHDHFSFVNEPGGVRPVLFTEGEYLARLARPPNKSFVYHLKNVKSIDEAVLQTGSYSRRDAIAAESSRTRQLLISFLKCALQWRPERRWTAEELLTHPFITDRDNVKDVADYPSLDHLHEMPPSRISNTNS